MDSIGDIYSNYYSQTSASDVKASALEQKLNNNDLSEATDEELMDACKEFETYLLEQVLKEVKETIPKSEEEDNQYVEYFGDMMLQEYASLISENSDLGIAQTLYESMKNSAASVNIKTAEDTAAAAGTAAEEQAGQSQSAAEAAGTAEHIGINR